MAALCILWTCRVWTDENDPLYTKRRDDRTQGMAESDMHKFAAQGRLLKQ